MIKAAGDLARKFDMRYLVGTHRHMGGTVDENIGALQQRVSQKAVGAQILFSEFFLLILVGGYALQPAQRSDHRQQQMQLGMLRHPRLDKQGGACGIHPCG